MENTGANATVSHSNRSLVDAVQKFRKVIRDYKPCLDCGTDWCEEMAQLLVTTAGMVEDIPTADELNWVAKAS